MQNDLPFRLLLLRSGRIFTDKINEVLQKYDLNYSLWQVLYIIAHAEQITLIEIAQELKISQPAVSKRVFELEQKQLIETVASQNRREKIVKLNTQGQQRYQICRSAIDQLEQNYLTGISATEVAQTRDLLNRFLNNILHEEHPHD